MTDEQFVRHNAGERIFEGSGSEAAGESAAEEPATKKRKLDPIPAGFQDGQEAPVLQDQIHLFWDPKVASKNVVIHDGNRDMFTALVRDWITMKKGDYSKPICSYIAHMISGIKVAQDCWAEPAWSNICTVISNEFKSRNVPSFTSQTKTTHAKLRVSLNKVYNRYWICLYECPFFKKILQDESSNKDAIIAVRKVLQNAMNKMAVDIYAEYSTNGAPAGDFDEGTYPKGRGYEGGRQSKAPAVIQDVDEQLLATFRRIGKLVDRAERDPKSIMHEFPAFGQIAEGIRKFNKGEKRVDLTVDDAEESD